MSIAPVVGSVSLKHPIRLAYLRKEQGGRQSDVVLCSTDIDLAPLQRYRGYAARFPIEFIFRDARQFTGLADCQARSPQALDSRQCQPLGPDPGQSRATLHSSQSGRTPQVLHGLAQTAGSK